MAQGTSNASNGFLVSGLTILFVYLKLTSQITWSWWWVLSPCWIVAGLCVIAVLVGVIWAAVES